MLLKEDYKAAEVAVLPVVDGFVQLLAVDRGTYLLRLTLYNLPAFTESLRRALRSVLLTSDARLAKALNYCNHAQFLNRMRDDLPEHAKAHSYLVADIFSSYYRAASAIIGDRNKDKDYQLRYRKIGLTSGDWKKIERVRKLRNDYGVAHYDLEDKSEQLRQELTTAAEVIKKVITRYIANIKSKEPSEAG